MINNEILSFIKDQIARGATKDKVKEMLVSEGGWDGKDVEEAFETINFSGTSYPSVLRNAEALEMKSGGNDKMLSSAPSESAKIISNDVRPTAFAPGLSHMEQPKIMEPSTPGSDLRARIASGISEKVASIVSPVSVSRPTIQAIIAEPAISSSYPQPFVATPGTPPVSVAPLTPATVSRDNESSPQLSPTQSAEQGSSSLLPSLNKTAAPSSVFSPAKAFVSSLQSMAVFPKSPTGGIHASSLASAKFAAMQQGQKPRGGRLLLGLFMFLAGLVIGGILMNAYMMGYLKTDTPNGIVEKGMDLIGLGTVTAPVPEAPSVPTAIQTTDASDAGGS